MSEITDLIDELVAVGKYSFCMDNLLDTKRRNPHRYKVHFSCRIPEKKSFSELIAELGLPIEVGDNTIISTTKVNKDNSMTYKAHFMTNSEEEFFIFVSYLERAKENHYGEIVYPELFKPFDGLFVDVDVSYYHKLKADTVTLYVPARDISGIKEAKDSLIVEFLEGNSFKFRRTMLSIFYEFNIKDEHELKLLNDLLCLMRLTGETSSFSVRILADKFNITRSINNIKKLL